LASVISFSTSGLTALAFAWLVLIRSCSMTSLQRFRSSALRCAESRLSLCRVFWWRIASLLGLLVLPQVQGAGFERLDDLVNRLLAEVRDRVELGLRLRDQIPDRLDAGPLEAVVRADAELELLDQDAPLLALHRRRHGSRLPVAEAAVERSVRALTELGQPLDIGEDRQL